MHPPFPAPPPPLPTRKGGIGVVCSGKDVCVKLLLTVYYISANAINLVTS